MESHKIMLLPEFLIFVTMRLNFEGLFSLVISSPKIQRLLTLLNNQIRCLLIVICVLLVFQYPALSQVISPINLNSIEFDAVESPLQIDRSEKTCPPKNPLLDFWSPYGELDEKRWYFCKTFGLFAQNKEKNVEIGKITFSKSIVSVSPEKTSGYFHLWHVSLPITVKPSWENNEILARGIPRLGLDFIIKDTDGRASSQLLDVLPNTAFEALDYGAKVQGELNFAVTLGQDNKWISAHDTASSKVNFWWNWNPKINVVSSGASGNKAYIILSKKSDNTGWIGKISVELLLLVPNGKSHYKLDISPYIYLNNDEKVRTSPISPVDIYLLEE